MPAGRRLRTTAGRTAGSQLYKVDRQFRQKPPRPAGGSDGSAMRRPARYAGAVRSRVLGLLLLLLACGPPRTVVTARALVEDPTGFDGQAIVLVGTVENPRRGPGYTSFTLTDGTARVPVIAWGTQPVGMGDVIEVRGALRTQLRAGDQLLPDTVEARFVRVVRAAAQPPGTPVSPP